MRFVIRTTYDQRALTVMARTLRKTLRRRRSRMTHLFGWVIVVLAVLLLVADGWPFDAGGWVTLLAAAAIVVVTFTEDQLNGWLAGRKMLPGMETGETVFSPEFYVTATSAAETRWSHEQVVAVYETKDYFVFFLSNRHGQIYDKHGFLEGTPEEFRAFISEKAGKPVKYIK